MGRTLGAVAVGLVCSLVGVVPGGGVAFGQSCALNLELSFNPSEGGQMNSIGFDATRDEVIVHFSGSGLFHVYDRSGVFLRTIPKASDVGGNDGDIDVTQGPVSIGGTVVPAGTLVEFENENNPPRVVASSVVDGTELAIQDGFDGGAIGQWVGGSISPVTGAFYAVDWQQDTVQALDVSAGMVSGSFPVAPVDVSQGFDVFFGDIGVLGADGFVYVVSSSQQRVRVFTPGGLFVTDLDVTGTALGGSGVAGLSGIGFDDGRGEAWFSSTDGNVYLVSGFNGLTCPGDADGDELVALPDLLAVLSAFGETTDGGPAAGDVDGCRSGTVDLSDLLAVLSAFGESCV